MSRARISWLMLVVAMLLAAAHAFATQSPDDAKRGNRPPGSTDDDPSPSGVIFPEQEITIRFDHKFHVGTQHLACKSCHPGALTSDSSGDDLIPRGTVCDDCHLTDHGDLRAVKAGSDEAGQCAFCHEGYKASDGNTVRALEIPRANMIFSHKRHATRNINCAQCHGRVEEVGLATREQLPRMRGCLHCHQMDDAQLGAGGRGDAKGACETCHLRAGARGTGLIRTSFPEGKLTPPSWLRDAEHGPDFIERHRRVAGADSQFCASCHSENFCTDCHDGRVRPRRIHPNDYISMHPIDARTQNERCTSCHREQSFCLDCHLRAGVGQSSPPGVQPRGARFHPAGWTGPIRGPGHHAFEAQRNLNACVSCHVERDCVACHGGAGIGGGFNIHPAGFLSSCAMQMRRNPRPCFVCHQPFELQKCR